MLFTLLARFCSTFVFHTLWHTQIGLSCISTNMVPDSSWGHSMAGELASTFPHSIFLIWSCPGVQSLAHWGLFSSGKLRLEGFSPFSTGTIITVWIGWPVGTEDSELVSGYYTGWGTKIQNLYSAMSKKIKLKYLFIGITVWVMTVTVLCINYALLVKWDSLQKLNKILKPLTLKPQQQKSFQSL